MRLSIQLNDDLYRMARSLAAAEDCSISAAVNKLIRHALDAPISSTRSKKSRFPTSRCRADHAITSEMVRCMDEEDDTP